MLSKVTCFHSYILLMYRIELFSFDVVFVCIILLLFSLLNLDYRHVASQESF